MRDPRTLLTPGEGLQTRPKLYLRGRAGTATGVLISYGRKLPFAVTGASDTFTVFMTSHHGGLSGIQSFTMVVCAHHSTIEGDKNNTACR